ncbi:hypothetical protein [Pseudomonas sp. Pseusp97]|uniref:hypothetical protein n=1 Tax=Pseudomonas sp. Pseusp97 TaxID=3243065 RepID=UPI0039A64A98
MIKTIPMWKMLIATKGQATGLAVLALLPVFIVASAWMFFDGLQIGKRHQAAMGFIGLLFFIVCALACTPSKKYIPGKTFQAYRSKKILTQKAIKYGYGIIVLVVAVLWVLAPEGGIKTMGFGMVGISSLYVLSKSLKFHADVDFSTNEYLSSALGFSVGEKVLASYQNFYADEIENGSNAFAVTATKIIVASFDGCIWRKLTRNLDQISLIGIVGSEDQKYFVKLVFCDGVEVLLIVGLYEKITSNPILVIRKLLGAIDASLLGGGVSQSASRRRVVINSGAVSVSETPASEGTSSSTASFRNIELGSEVLISIQNAEEVVPGRKLEL